MFGWRQARSDLGRIRRLEADRNILGLIAELGNEAEYGRYMIIRSHAANALGRLGDVRAVPYLTELAHDPKDIVRSSAILALSSLRANDAAAVFLEGLSDSAETVRMASAEGLGRLGDPAAVPKLHAVIDKDHDAEVRMVAAEALLELGDSDVLKRLPEIMRAVSRRVRGHPRWKKLAELADV